MATMTLDDLADPEFDPIVADDPDPAGNSCSHRCLRGHRVSGADWRLHLPVSLKGPISAARSAAWGRDETPEARRHPVHDLLLPDGSGGGRANDDPGVELPHAATHRKIASRYTEDEKNAMFSGTAKRHYKIG
jgi:hypothetical protein